MTNSQNTPATAFTTVIDAATLAQRLTEYRILDCRARLGDPGFGARVHAEGHIPGALRADLDADFASPAGKSGRHPLPDPDVLVVKCRRWGINDSTQVVVYDDMGGLFAARGWWVLRWLGHEAVAVLDGGWQSWQKMGGPIETVTQPVAPGQFTRRSTRVRIVEAPQLSALMATAGRHVTLVDARSEARFRGEQEPVDHTPGHIPGAICRPATDNLDQEQHFRPASALAERFVDLEEDVVCYCGSGVTAAHNILALRIAGHPEAALYPGSWSEWIEDSARPIATGP